MQTNLIIFISKKSKNLKLYDDYVKNISISYARKYIVSCNDVLTHS